MIPTTRRHIRLAAPLAFTALGAGLALLAAGPLNPPSGAVTSTNKTLAEIEPRTALSSTNTPGDNDATPSVFKITTSGSYYLTGNVSLGSGRNAIEVTASGVTIDLNGFQINSLGGAAGIIATSSAIERLTIRNGAMLGVTTAVSFAGIPSVTVEDLKIETCTTGGIVIGDHGAVRRCTVVNCGSGVTAGNSAEVTGVTVADSDSGISCGLGSRVNACTVTGCGTVIDSRAISVQNGGVVSGCTVANNTGKGIVTFTGCSVIACNAYNNTSDGVLASVANTIADCTAYSNGGDGIATGNGCTVSRCTLRSNTGSGVQTGTDCTITGCNSTSNTVSGIATGTQCSVAGNTCSENTVNGIVVYSRSTVRGNTCNGNAGSGIRLATTGSPIPSASGCRIEENTCNSNDTGIYVFSLGAGNMIVRNTCGSNTTNYDINPTNGLGTVVSISSSGITTSNSFANFEY